MWAKVWMRTCHSWSWQHDNHMRRRKTPKTKATLRKHVRRRAVERFGFTLNSHQIDQIVRQIQKGEAQFIDRQSLNITRWFVTLDDQKMAVVYDKKRRMLRTVLTESQIKNEIGGLHIRGLAILEKPNEESLSDAPDLQGSPSPTVEL